MLSMYVLNLLYLYKLIYFSHMEMVNSEKRTKVCFEDHVQNDYFFR